MRQISHARRNVTSEGTLRMLSHGSITLPWERGGNIVQKGVFRLRQGQLQLEYPRVLDLPALR